MTQLRSKFDFEDLNEPAQSELKTLPNSFTNTEDEMSLVKSLVISLILHPLCVFMLWLIIIGLTLLGLVVPKADRPDWKKKDLEFVIVTNEAEPIDKNTKYRSDRNSRAGGIHDPNKRVSEPSPSPSPAPSPAPQPAPKQNKPAPQAPQRVQPQQVKPVQKPIQQPTQTQAPVQQKPAPQKPSQTMAPVQRPVYKPSAEPPKPAMPMLATAPKSPFSVAVPKTAAPVGPRPSAGTGTSSGSPASGGGSTSAGRGSGTSMPSPQLSTSRGTSAGRGTSGGTGSRGTGYGRGNMGNPGPGNPSGPPGIDAIKSPDWGPYMRELERRIKRNWNPPKGDASKRVVVLFKIGRDGRLLSIRVGKSSGSVANDEAAKAAIELTAPFKPLPPEFKGSSIDIEFTFDYNVLGASYR